MLHRPSVRGRVRVVYFNLLGGLRGRESTKAGEMLEAVFSIQMGGNTAPSDVVGIKAEKLLSAPSCSEPPFADFCASCSGLWHTDRLDKRQKIERGVPQPVNASW